MHNLHNLKQKKDEYETDSGSKSLHFSSSLAVCFNVQQLCKSDYTGRCCCQNSVRHPGGTLSCEVRAPPRRHRQPRVTRLTTYQTLEDRKGAEEFCLYESGQEGHSKTSRLLITVSLWQWGFESVLFTHLLLSVSDRARCTSDRFPQKKKKKHLSGPKWPHCYEPVSHWAQNAKS